MNVLIINGHPRKGSLTDAFADVYCEAAIQTGAVIRRLELRALSFNPNVEIGTGRYQTTEPDLQQSRDLILWADHIVFIYPTWWGTMPALLKAFLDRTLIAGFAFEEIEGGTGYAPLLRGKSAQLITTMDTPLFVYKWIYKAPGHNAMRRATLQFCGFTMARTLNFGPVRNSTETQRNKWIDTVKKESLKLERGPITYTRKIIEKIFIWLRAIRLQFYPMTFIAYTLGAFAAKSSGYSIDRSIFWLGYLWLFLVEVTTVLANDYFDYSSDRINRYFSPFTGGSRVLVDNLLSRREIKTGIFTFLTASFIALGMLLPRVAGSLDQAIPVCAIGALLALGYTIPPMKLVYRGLGELTVCITHSFAVIVCGFIFQGGKLENSFPWALSLPLFFAIMPSIILAGIPDFEADRTVSKKTIAVMIGKKNAARLAIAFSWLATISVVVLQTFNLLDNPFNGLLYVIIPHAILVTLLTNQYLQKAFLKHRIDTLMIATLTYLLWFGLIPLLNLL